MRGTRLLVLCAGLALSCLAPGTAASLCLDPVSGCMVSNAVNGWFNGKMEEFGESAARGALKQLEPLTDKILTQQVPALIDQVDHAVAKNLVSAEEGVARLIKHVERSLDASLAKALTQTDEFIKGTFRTEVVDVFNDSLNGFREAFFRDISKTLDQAFYAATCTTVVAGQTVNQETTYFFDRIDGLIERFSFLGSDTSKTACHDQTNVQARTHKSEYSISESFRLWKCALTNSHDLNTPASAIAFHYVDIEQRAHELMCRHYHSPTGFDVYVREWVEAGRVAAVWERARTR